MPELAEVSEQVKYLNLMKKEQVEAGSGLGSGAGPELELSFALYTQT